MSTPNDPATAMEEAAKRIELPMECIHGSDNGAEAAKTLARANDILMTGGYDPEDKAQFWLSAVVYQMEHRWQASIEAIDCDQWAAVLVQVYEGHELAKRLYVQCDLVEHGLAAIVCWLADNRPDQFAENEEVPVGDDPPSPVS